jgi:hypothetical protein
MAKKSLPIEQSLHILAETPPYLADLTSELSTARLHQLPAPEAWSINEVLAHLRACADVWGECMVTIVEQDLPTIQAINPKRWLKSTDYLTQPFHQSFDAFTVQRTQLLSFLTSLTGADWDQTAIVKGAGKPIERSLSSFVDRMARHERTHNKQIKAIVKFLGC